MCVLYRASLSHSHCRSYIPKPAAATLLAGKGSLTSLSHSHCHSYLPKHAPATLLAGMGSLIRYHYLRLGALFYY